MWEERLERAFYYSLLVTAILAIWAVTAGSVALAVVVFGGVL